ncbi:cytochrome b/b6 domain-containing protein [Thalassospira lucentensis]|uniref:cytochrome b/b6 domain-containing protein n=1 Tax=Thalassospira lucentensis TaxID=168935 RepID=UPI003D2EC7D7
MVATVKVWDPLVRVFHWGLVASFLVAWISAKQWNSAHEAAGYCAAGLVAFRLLWGAFGPHYARFAQFVRGPSDVVGYVRDIWQRREARYIGHNPVGAVMILVLIAVMAATAFSGWLFTTDRFWGVGWVMETHEFFANGLIILVVVHVAGVVLASMRHGENLVRAMISGRKRRPSSDDIT